MYESRYSAPCWHPQLTAINWDGLTCFPARLSSIKGNRIAFLASVRWSYPLDPVCTRPVRFERCSLFLCDGTDEVPLDTLSRELCGISQKRVCTFCLMRDFRMPAPPSNDACWRSAARTRVCDDLRNKGLVVKDGLSFGCDFVVYAGDPGAVHASCLVFVTAEQVSDDSAHEPAFPCEVRWFIEVYSQSISEAGFVPLHDGTLSGVQGCEYGKVKYFLDSPLAIACLVL